MEIQNLENDKLRMTLPTGRIKDRVMSLLGAIGINYRENGRSYRPGSSDDGIQTKLIKSQNIPKLVELGRHDCGFCGYDWIIEQEADVIELLDLGFDPVRIVAAMPEEMDLEALKKSGKKLVVASEYRRLTELFLEKNGLSKNAIFLRAFGATEALPPEDADIIVDNTASGATLVANRLKIVNEVLTSTTRFVCSREAFENPVKRKKLLEMTMLMKGCLEAKERVLIEMNVDEDALERLVENLPAMRSPTIARLYNEKGYAVKIAVEKAAVSSLIPELLRLGARDILEYRVDKIVAGDEAPEQISVSTAPTFQKTVADKIEARKEVLAMDRYQSPKEGRRGYVRLDFNESTAPQVIEGYCSYPEYDPLLKELASIFEVDKENILPTNGTDEALSLIASTFIEPGRDRALVSTPTFAMIKRSVVLAGAELVEIPVKANLQYDTEAIEEALNKQNIKLAVFASPDNPTGSLIDRAILERWLETFPGTLFVLDEAYADYANVSTIDLTEKYKNILVTRTFSKAWGLAGLRLGVIVGDSEKLELIARLRMPYSVNSYVAELAPDLLSCKNQVAEEASDLMKRKAKLIADLTNLNLDIVPGSANFFLVKLPGLGDSFIADLKKAGILVRDRSSKVEGDPMNGAVRITVGTKEENQLLLEAVKSWQKANARELEQISAKKTPVKSGVKS
ncbi:MAG: ATP phosphoribosyltransferase [Candidatus Obscuribacterales bacterium]|nr:ATP phosphoribosyltransferase [Candidatus Obscuribacterales bacterium]